jgi:thioesterase domain-containing protein/acyl carrier protein
VKIRGARVELGEIEALVVKHPGVAAAAVKAWPDGPSGERWMAAYFVPRRGATPDAVELRQFLRRLVPDYMVPSRYVPLRALPTTPNGKVDRNALPEPRREASWGGHVEPGSERERQLAAIWSETLGVPRVDLHDDFFDLGGHSLLVPRLLRRIEETFGRRLPLVALFHAPTVERMAALLGDSGSATALLPQIVELQPRGSRPPLFWLGAEPVFRGLAEAVGPDQPFLAVDLRLDEPRADVQCGLEEIAHGLVQAIRAAQPAGPYYLGGRCTKGILAFEVASQLMRAGHEVGLLVLLDATNPTTFRRIDELAYHTGKLKHHIAETMHRHGRERWAYAADRVRRGLDRVVRWTGRERGLRELEVSDVLERAARTYEPRPYAGDVVLLQPAERPAVLDYQPGWTRIITSGFTAHDLPGTHWTMLQQPYVQDLGAVLDACLARAQVVAPARPKGTV